MYPFLCTQEDKAIVFDKVREEFYRTAVSIPGKARHKGFMLSVIGRAPMEWIEHWIKEGCFYILALRIGPTVAKEPHGCQYQRRENPTSQDHYPWYMMSGASSTH